MKARSVVVTTHVYRVPDVSCEHCVKAIQTELQTVPGVSHVDVNLEHKLVTVQASASVLDSELRSGIDRAGYDIAE